MWMQLYATISRGPRSRPSRSRSCFPAMWPSLTPLSPKIGLQKGLYLDAIPYTITRGGRSGLRADRSDCHLSAAIIGTLRRRNRSGQIATNVAGQVGWFRLMSYSNRMMNVLRFRRRRGASFRPPRSSSLSARNQGPTWLKAVSHTRWIVFHKA